MSESIKKTDLKDVNLVEILLSLREIDEELSNAQQRIGVSEHFLNPREQAAFRREIEESRKWLHNSVITTFIHIGHTPRPVSAYDSVNDVRKHADEIDKLVEKIRCVTEKIVHDTPGNDYFNSLKLCMYLSGIKVTERLHRVFNSLCWRWEDEV